MTSVSATDHAEPAGWVCVGKIGKPHGLKGEFHLQSFTEDARGIFALDEIRLGPQGKKISLRLARPTRNGFVVTADGFDDRTVVDALRNKELYTRRDSFAPPVDGTFYHLDLVGLEARDSQGNALGAIVAIHNFGAGDILEIHLDQPTKKVGQSLMLPFTEALVPEVNIEDGFVITRAKEWLADEIIANPEGDEQS